MRDGIGYKMGLLVTILHLHDFLQCAEGVLNRRSRNSRLSCTDYCGQHIIDIKEIIVPCRETQIHVRVCQVRKVDGCGLSRSLWDFCLGTLWFLFLMAFMHALFVFVISWEDIRTFFHDWRFTSYHWLLQICNIDSDATCLFYAVPFFVGMCPRESTNMLSKHT